MADPIVRISLTTLTEALKDAYERGCGGWKELSQSEAEGMAKSLVEKLSGPKTDSKVDYSKLIRHNLLRAGTYYANPNAPLPPYTDPTYR